MGGAGGDDAELPPAGRIERRGRARVDVQMQDFRRDEAIRRVVPASERILVCVSPSPMSAKLVRSAKRLAVALRGEWVAAYVETPGTAGLSDADRARVEQNLRRAE